MGLANKSVVLYESIKVGKKWHFRAVDEDSSHFSDGPFYVSWYDGKKKQMEPVGRDPGHALRMVTLKRAALAYVSAGGELSTRNAVQKPAGEPARDGAKNARQNQQAVEGTKSGVKDASPDAKSPENRKKVIREWRIRERSSDSPDVPCPLVPVFYPSLPSVRWGNSKAVHTLTNAGSSDGQIVEIEMK